MLVLITVAALVHPSRSAEGQDVPEQYVRLFEHYTEKSVWWDRFKRLMGGERGEVGRSIALVAGISEYPNLPIGQKKLYPAMHDRTQLVDVLRQPQKFDEIVVLWNEDMSYENLRYFLRIYFPKQLERYPKSRLLFAYSGHGFSHQGGTKSYLLTSRAKSLKDREHAIDIKQLKLLLDESIEQAHHGLVLINSCYGGAFLSRTAFGREYRPIGPGAYAITAGSSNELVWSDEQVGPGSIFFEKVLAGLRGHADVFPERTDEDQGDGLISASELYAYVRQEIGILTDYAQTPQSGDISKDGSFGEFFFLSGRKEPNKAALENRSFTGNVSMGPGLHSLPGSELAHAHLLYRRRRYAESYRIFRSLALKGDAIAMFYVGRYYRRGHNVRKDDVEAERWFAKALPKLKSQAEARDPFAMYYLGRMFRNGYATQRNNDTALYWYDQSARFGYAKGMWRLGKLYYDVGEHQKGLMWLKKAAAAGISEASRDLQKLRDE